MMNESKRAWQSLNQSIGPQQALTILIDSRQVFVPSIPRQVPVQLESRQVKSKSHAICCTEAVQCHIELNGTVLRTTADVITRE